MSRRGKEWLGRQRLPKGVFYAKCVLIAQYKESFFTEPYVGHRFHINYFPLSFYRSCFWQSPQTPWRKFSNYMILKMREFHLAKLTVRHRFTRRKVHKSWNVKLQRRNIYKAESLNVQGHNIHEARSLKVKLYNISTRHDLTRSRGLTKHDRISLRQDKMPAHTHSRNHTQWASSRVQPAFKAGLITRLQAGAWRGKDHKDPLLL